MKIGIIGAGHIGGTIGELWAKAGHPVFFSSRHPEELKELVERLGPLAQAGSVDHAIAFGDVVFIAVPYGALPQIGDRRSWPHGGQCRRDARSDARSRSASSNGRVRRSALIDDRFARTNAN